MCNERDGSFITPQFRRQTLRSSLGGLFVENRHFGHSKETQGKRKRPNTPIGIGRLVW